MPPQTRPTPPKLIGPAGRKFFRDTAGAFDFENDPVGTALLAEASYLVQGIADDRAAISEAGGPYISDRFGKPKEHPAAVALRAKVNLLRLTCRELGLEPATTSADDVRLPRIVRGA